MEKSVNLVGKNSLLSPANNFSMTILELIGWLGAGSLLIGFALNLFQKITANSAAYLLLNLIGSLLLLYNAYENGAYPFVAVNFVWVVFSGYKLIQMKTRS